MDKRHIIEDAEFDISFDSVAAAREHEPGLADFIRERLLPLADEVFCELAEDGMVARIDRLEIDLGDVRSGGFRDEMESRFGQKLRSVLREKMRSLATLDAPSGVRIDRRQAERGRLESYLETGRMPWHADLATGEAADAMLRQAVEQQTDAFVDFLRTTPHRDVVVKRLARQFPDRLLLDVIKLLAPAHADVIGELTGKLGEIWRRETGGIGEREFKARLWERLLGESLQAGAPDPARLLGKVAKDSLARHARRGEDGGRDVPAGSPERGAEWEAVPHLRAVLESALGTGDAGALTGRWADLSAEHRELVREVFMRRMGDIKLQKKVAEGFPEHMLLDLLDILSPRDEGMIVALSGLPELRGEDGAKNVAFWTCTLNYLHGSPGGDLAAYARILLDRLSASGEVRHRLVQAIAAVAPELALAVAPEELATPQSAVETARAAESARAEELYRRVTQRLSGTGSEPEFAALVEEMASDCPETLARLQRELQSGELRADIGRLDAREAGQMVTALIRLNSGARESDFLRAVEAQARQARDRQRYYRYVLERLIRNETVDLETAASEAALDDADSEIAQQTASVGDAAPGRQLTAPQARQAGGREEIARATGRAAEPARAEELYRRVTQRLSGTGSEPEFAALVEEMTSVCPETLAILQRQLQAGELRADIGRLDAREARQLVTALIRLNSGAKDGDFLRAIERYAGRAKSEAGYYRHILDSLLRNRTIDLEAALRLPATSLESERQAVPEPGEMAAGARSVGAKSGARLDDHEAVDASTFGAEPALAARLQRLRLEEALGRAEGVGAIWGDLLQNHAEMLREVFLRRLEDASARAKLASGFPESMLLDLIRALVPPEGGFVEMLAGQPELRTDEAAGGKNIPFWEHTLSYLHACGLRGYTRFEYARGLVRSLAERGFPQAAVMQAVVRADPALGAAVSGEGGATELVGASEGAMDSSPEATRTGELLRQLLHRSHGRDRTLAREIGELAEAWPEVVREFYRLLGAGEAGLDAMTPTAEEAARHVAAFIFASHGRMGDEFRRDIEAHAGKAGNELGYYRAVLEMLVRNRVLDIEAAMAASPDEESAVADDAGRGETSKTPAPGTASLRIRFESALAQGNAEALAGVWDELRFNRGNLVREVCQRRLGDDAIRKRLAERFPGTMLFDLIRVLAPLACSFIENVEKQLGLQPGMEAGAVRRTVREHALAHLHAHGARGFRRIDYARDLMQRLALEGVENGVFLQAMAAIYPALALSLAGEDAGRGNEVADTAAHAARFRARLELAFASGDAGGLAAHREALRGAHRELVREVYARRMGDVKLQEKVAEGFPESMLMDLLRILSPRDGSLIVALSGLPELRGEGGAKNAAFWTCTLNYLHGSPGDGLAAYARNLIDRLSVPGEARHRLAQAIATIAPELALAAAPEKSATPQSAVETARAEELGRRLAQRLGGAGGGQDISAMLEELESIAPDNLAALLRRLQTGELRADIGRLDAGEVRQLVFALARMNPGAKDGDFLRAVEAQARQARDRQRYYRYVLERLIRNEKVDFEAVLDDAAPGNDAIPQAERSAGDTAVDKESAQVPNVAHSSDEVATPARTTYLRTLLDAALTEGNAAELAGAWDEMRAAHAGLVRERFERLMGDEGAQARVAQGWPTKLLVELVRILAPLESGFVETVAAQLPSGRGENGIARLWQRTLGYLYSTRAFDRRAYAESLLRDLDERAADRRDVMQAVGHADAALGEMLTAAEAGRAGGREESGIEDEPGIAGESGFAGEPGRAEELSRRLAQRLGGAGGDMDIVAAIEELASAYPETLARLLRRLQTGDLHAESGALDAHEARKLAFALVRLNSGAKDGDFLRAIERYAGRAKSEAGYYRHILDSLLRNRDVDLEAAAEALSQEAVRKMPADFRSGETGASRESAAGNGHRPQTKTDPSPAAMAGIDAVQDRNSVASDRRGSADDSESAEEIYIANAGMVLVSPYLPQLFRMLDLTEGPKFMDERAAERAIHLLQFMVNESCDSPEFLLPLNKLMCGVPTGVPIVREIELLQREKEAIEGMLNGIIQNWTILGNTSVRGLRESFLQRGGRLQLKEDNWHLKVETKGIDVLLDRLPWSFALIKHPWMRRPIYVEWR